MAEQKQVFSTEFMALPPLRMALGEAPVPEIQVQLKQGRPSLIGRRDLEVPVKRLIALLEDEKK